MTEDIKSRLEQIRAGKVPKGYRQSPSGVIPRDWHDTKMSDITEEIKETAGNKEYETLSISAGVGFVNQAKKFGREMSGAQYSKYTVLRHGDFSYNKGNSNLYPQGCIYRLNDRKEAAVPNVFESFRFDSLNGDYYEQLFVSGYLNKQLYSKINHGVRDDGLLNLTGKDFYSCHLPVPPLPEQQKIAEILMQCDQMIALKKERIEEEKKRKKWLMEKLFSVKYVGRSTKRLRECVKWFGGGTPDKDEPQYWKHGTIKWVSSQEVKGLKVSETTYRITDRAVKESTTNIAPAYSLLLVTRSGILKRSLPVAYISEKMAINQDIKALVPRKEVNYYYLLSYLRYKEKEIVSSYVKTGTTVQSLIFNLFLNIEIPTPGYSAQELIAKALFSVDSMIDLLEAECEQWQQKKKALMQLLLTGIARVNA